MFNGWSSVDGFVSHVQSKRQVNETIRLQQRCQSKKTLENMLLCAEFLFDILGAVIENL